MSIVITDLVSQFGAYYINQGQNLDRLKKKLYQMAETAGYFANRPTDDTIWRSTYNQLDSVLQPFQKAWTPKGTFTSEPNQFNLFKIKIDKEETPDDIESSWIGFLDAMDELDRSKWPFIRYLLEEHIMPRKEEDHELELAFLGVYAAPTPGTAGATATSMDGIRKVIRGYNTAGRTGLGDGAIATGAIAADDADFVQQVEDWCDEVPYLFRNKLDYIFMSDANATKYKRGKRKKYGKDVQFINGTASNLDTVEDYPSIKIARLQSMGTSDMIWASPAINRIRPLKKASLMNTFLVQQFSPRVVSIYTDYWEAMNFEVPEFLFHNDLDLV